jgi:hypothetical protein
MRTLLRLAVFLMSAGLLLNVAPSFSQTRQSASPAERVPFCTLAAHSKDYNGHLVVTEAAIGKGFHRLVLFDPLCQDVEIESGQLLSASPTSYPPYKRGTALDKRLNDLISSEGIARIVFVGRVDSSRDAYGEGSPLEINIESLISVYEIPLAERQWFHIAGGKLLK